MKLIFIAILIVVVCLLLIYPISYSDILDTENFDVIRNITLIVSAIVSLINLALVNFFFFSERRFKRSQGEIERKSFWYRKLFLEENIHEIKSSFTNLLNPDLYNKELSEGEFLTVVRKEFRENKRNLLERIQIIEIIDHSFYQMLDNHIFMFEDLFMKQIEIYYFNDEKKDSIFEIVKKNKAQVISLLYQYEQNGYSQANDSKWDSFVSWIKSN